jgi:hypothetical protein
MKKPLFVLLLLYAATIIQCSKSDDDPSPNDPPGNGELEITSVSPKVIYADDEITIVGKGFSTTKTDHAVELGIYSQGKWQPVDNKAPYEVLSATETQLVVRALDPETLNLKLQTYYDYGIRVTVKESKTDAPFDGIKKAIFFNQSQSTWIEHVVGCFLYMQAGDSLYLSAGGLYGACTLTIDHKTIATKKVNEDRELHFRIPKLLFGQGNDDCNEEELPVTVTNGDGKTLTKMYHIVKSPPMSVYGASFNKATYSSGDAKAFLTIKGYSIYSTAMVRLSSPNGYASEGNVGVQNYPDEAVVEFTLSGLAKGTYNVQIKEHDYNDYGFSIASFKLE